MEVSSVATFRSRASARLVLVLCVRVLFSPLLLPLAIVNECAGKLVAYLCRDPRDQHWSNGSSLVIRADLNP